MKRWAEEEFNDVLGLIKEGFSYKEISDLVNRSKKGVKEKLNKEGFSFEMFNPPIGKEERHCLECKKNFKVVPSDVKKFCGSSCAAKFNNRNRRVENTIEKIKKKCKNCRAQIVSKHKKQKYCSNKCQSEFQQNYFI